MGFAVAADAYDRFMGTFARPLAVRFADFARVPADAHALDVGCGPGALLGELLARGVAAEGVDPSASFVSAARERFPGTRVLEGGVEALPYDDGAFDATLAQLVLHLVADASAGAAQMARVTRAGGVVAACVWDIDEGPLATFWRAVASLHDGSGAPAGERARSLQSEGGLAALLESAGLDAVEETALEVEVAFPAFDAWWATFELGVGPPGDHVAALDEGRRAALRERCRELLPGAAEDGALTVRGVARAARGIRR